METKDGGLGSDLATRVAGAMAAAPGVEAALVCDGAGTVLGAAATATAARDAGLAAFVAQRAEALSGDGDLRGMGRLVSGSHFQQLSASWPGGEAVVIAFADARLFVSFRRGVSAESSTPALRTILRRYS